MWKLHLVIKLRSYWSMVALNPMSSAFIRIGKFEHIPTQRGEEHVMMEAGI